MHVFLVTIKKNMSLSTNSSGENKGFELPFFQRDLSFSSTSSFDLMMSRPFASGMLWN
jgi:hypothetical protein